MMVAEKELRMASATVHLMDKLRVLRIAIQMVAKMASARIGMMDQY